MAAGENSAANSRPVDSTRSDVPFAAQVVSWGLGVAACVAGMLDLVAEWSPELALIQFVLLALAPILYMLGGRAKPAVPAQTHRRPRLWVDWSLCLFVGGVSLVFSSGIGGRIGDLPPAYHDEYSYVFQAKTLLAGRFFYPSPEQHPELFDQMHVLNEGRMASRYYPGTGLWLAPFVAAGHPYLGQWIAGAIATILIYWTGKELGGRLTGTLAGLTMAVSPGIALFGNMLLAHHATLMSLSAFLLGILRWRRTRSATDAWVAGCGLSFAMLCRPMTAAGFGLPYGLDVLIWLIRPGSAAPEKTATDRPPWRTSPRVSTLLGLGIPLAAGWSLMFSYNHAITGEWLKSPYQMYTDVYTPRHVFGFNNVVRGEQHLGPRVIDSYDRWAQNLTPQLAATNVLNRWLGSWLWTFDLLPIWMSTAICLGSLHRWDRRWRLVIAAILSLHACHVPYWYVGIMGWHYVFETAPLWCLLLAGATSALVTTWRRDRRRSLILWWLVVLSVSVAGVYALPGEKKPRISAGIGSLAYPRRQHADARRWIEQQVDRRPALVLLDQKSMEDSHLDLVVNEPDLHSDVLLGRFRPGVTDLNAICRDFPDRTVYVANPERRTIRRIE